MTFDLFIGVDYSGAQTAESPLRALQVFVAEPGREPHTQPPPDGRRHWSRRSLAAFLRARIEDGPVLIGIDHGFSFPEAYFERHGLEDWPQFLTDFCAHWPTDRPGTRVEDLRPDNARGGATTELRLCERWTSSAKSVFLFDVQGSVAKSTHAGLPWLRSLREQADGRLFCWPFDGWHPPAGRSVIAEVYPSIFRQRYPRADRDGDAQDAYAVARWLEEATRHGRLARYLDPPLTPEERRIAGREGWILGIC